MGPCRSRHWSLGRTGRFGARSPEERRDGTGWRPRRAGETERGALQLLDQTALDDHSNQFSLQANKGHSFAALDLNQDVILAPDANGAALDWNENWVPRVSFELRLPPPASL